ncbi:hypothetical protein [Steroidobacter cummioxidans]|uniref:hypothetical protein n=1 Tax=Steroidobacter cummioxidans TaxID=1803913 RepID=UPI000E312DF2|nr:hypothetical protein [Steroidobacter cummioxidans]
MVSSAFVPRAALGQEISVAVTWQPIPLNGYKSWSLFLVCNPQWAKPQEAPKLRELYRQFLEFGQAIGDTHLAVWLVASRSAPARIDTARSVRFCENLNLPLADGPYVVVTGRYPGAALTEQPDTFVSDLGNHLVVSLNGLDAEQTTHLLETLAKQLEANDLQQRTVDSEAFWQALRSPFESTSDPVLRGVSATFKTSYFSTAIAQPSAALVTAAIPGAAAIGSGSTWTSMRADRTPVRLTAFVVGRTGLTFDAAKSSYKGTFAVALQNLDDSLDRGVLHDAVTIAVIAAGASAFNPSPVKVARLSEWSDVEVWVADPPPRKYRVSVSAGPNDPGNSLELDVSRPRAALRAASTSILGWGLGTTRLYVASRGNGGAWVQLSTDNGSLDPASIQLDSAGNAVTTLRSDVSGNASIAVDPLLWDAEHVVITFRAPYYFLLAAILGGLLGAFLRGRGRRKWVQALAIGIGTALLMTVGQAVGFNAWIATALGSNTLATSGEAVVFFLGAIAALIGVSVLLRPAAKTE